MLEGLAMFIVALPIILTNANYSSKLNTLDYVGICVWLIGLFIEIIADYQLLKFRRTHKSGELKTGLWAYATHPKYIGEVLVWSGVFLVSLSVPGAWWGVISPIFVAYYLFQFKKLRLNTHSRT
jgi:steroid 5-alpha reductase family enzyme